MSEKEIKIGKKAKITVQWSVSPLDYSREKEEQICSKMSKKYGVPKDSVKVEPLFISLNDNGEQVAMTNEVIENIQDPKYMQDLMLKYLKTMNIEDYDFDEILKIDSQINSVIDYSVYEKFRKYKLKNMRWSNFLSYGDDNYFDFTKLSGLVLLNGNPANQSGKSTFAYDLLHFLLFGHTSSGKADVLEDIFNDYREEKTEVSVEGCLEIDGEDYIIKRVLTRPSLQKRTEKSKVTQKVYYYKVVGDNYEELKDFEGLEAESGTKTNKIIKEAIGNEADFDLVISANAKNLSELISMKETEKGRLLSRWIGLLPLEEKDKIAREKYKKEIEPDLYSKKYNRETLKQEIEQIKVSEKEMADKITHDKELIDKCKSNLESFNQSRDTMLQSKKTIDETLCKVDVRTVETAMANLMESGKKKRSEWTTAKEKLAFIENVNFDENDYRQLVSRDKQYAVRLSELRNEITRLKEANKQLKNNEYCPTCKRKLDNVDNTPLIEENLGKIKTFTDEGIKLKGEADKVGIALKSMEKNRETYNEKMRLSVLVEKIYADMKLTASEYREKERLKKDFEDNKAAIENNNLLDISIRNVTENIKVETECMERYEREIAGLEVDIKNSEKMIKDREDMIDIINKEEKVIRTWKLYLQLVGKNGISKMVLRSTLPIINGEMKRLLNDVCDFDVEIRIDDHGDVNFVLIRDGVTSKLTGGSGFEQTAAALALRVVLGNISAMPRINFLLLDEVLGGVSDENFDKMKMLYERITEHYDFVFQITHLKSIIDWHKSIVTVKKEKNISSVDSTKTLVA